MNKLFFSVQVKLSVALSGLESADHNNRPEILHMRRPFTMLGSCLMYRVSSELVCNAFLIKYFLCRELWLVNTCQDLFFEMWSRFVTLIACWRSQLVIALVRLLFGRRYT